MVCFTFGIVNLITKSFIQGTAIIAAGVVTVIVGLFLKKTSIGIRGVVYSQVQLIIIIAMSLMKNELHCMFPLMLASLAIASLYYNMTNIIVHWAIMDVIVIVGLFFPQFLLWRCRNRNYLKGYSRT